MLILLEAKEFRNRLNAQIRDLEETNSSLKSRLGNLQKILEVAQREKDDLLTDLDQMRADFASERETWRESLDTEPKNISNNNSVSKEMESLASENSMLMGRLKEALRRYEESQKECDSIIAAKKCLEQQLSSCTQDWRKKCLQLEQELAEAKTECGRREMSICNWEERLLQINQWADEEKSSKEKQSACTLNLLSELKRLKEMNNGDGDMEVDVGSIMQKSQIHPYSVLDTNESAPLDWRQKKSNKINKMERCHLQMALNNELRAREEAENRLQDCELEMERLKK
ncbi:Serine/threonine-protein kinase MRCK beta [Cichlidogyrus casuarinus]|uniref:Serine/threonine-protein kinase MRCK beta n=1 Tax=Cichlidogyrus casuarinus TaxID=1844966 RepID=A0ABD2QBQ7_9PLAT